MSNDFRGKYEEKQKSPLKPFYPVIGFIVLLLAGALAFFASDPAATLLIDQVMAGNLAGQNFETIQAITGATIFGVTIAVLALVNAIITPTPENQDMLTEDALRKEKQEREREERAKKRRKRRMIEKMREENESYDI